MISASSPPKPLVESFGRLSVAVLNRMITQPRPTAIDVTVNCGEQVTTTVSIATSCLHRGGRRCWLVCPVCQSRRRDLLICGTALGCRRCFGAGYRSQRVRRGILAGAHARGTTAGGQPAIEGAIVYRDLVPRL